MCRRNFLLQDRSPLLLGAGLHLIDAAHCHGVCRLGCGPVCYRGGRVAEGNVRIEAIGDDGYGLLRCGERGLRFRVYRRCTYSMQSQRQVAMKTAMLFAMTSSGSRSKNC